LKLIIETLHQQLNNLKRNVMTEKELNRLADLIVEKLIGAQEENDAQFKKELAEIQALNPNLEIGTITQEQLIKQEIEPLEELMAEQIANEEYLEAKKTHDKIEELKKKYKL
tara:strand:- start:416 stop:751 length:336 start_codon:yes stop_codon:yes gene_type:complete